MFKLRPRNILEAALAAMLACFATLGIYQLLSGPPPSGGPPQSEFTPDGALVAAAVGIPCEERVVLAHVTSSERSPEWRLEVIKVLEHAIYSAAVCDQPLAAYAVAGGGTSVALATTADIADLGVVGPNERTREVRARSKRERIRSLAVGRFDQALEDLMGTTSSVAALYAKAAEHSGPATHVVLLGDFVNQEPGMDLNRPLAPREGARLAKTMSVPKVGNRRTTLVGLGQMDARVAVPGELWIQELRAFNEAICLASGAGSCRIYTTGSVTDALDSGRNDR